MRLDGKRVVVIGGSSGIGLETARLALSLGASVTIAGRSKDRLNRAAATLKNVPDRLRTVVADMADGQSIQSLFSGESQVDHVFVPAGRTRLTSRGYRRSRCVTDDQRIRYRNRSTGRWWWKPRLRDSLAFCDETSQQTSGYHSHCRNLVFQPLTPLRKSSNGVRSPRLVRNSKSRQRLREPLLMGFELLVRLTQFSACKRVSVGVSLPARA